MRAQLVQAQWIAGVAVLSIALAGCPGEGGETLDVSLTLSASSVLALQDGTPAQVNVTITRSTGDASSITLAATGLPAGIEAQFVQPGTGSAGTVTLVASASTPAGAYTVTIQAAEGESTASTPLAVQVGIVATVGNTVDTGLGGKLQEFVGTVFEPDAWRVEYFVPPDWKMVNALGPKHIRIAVSLNYIPMQSNTGRASDWDFTELDQTVMAVLGVSDRNPIFAVSEAPLFLTTTTSSASSGVLFDFNAANVQAFAQYCARLVRYYNTGGFDWGGQHFQAPAGTHITWWEIFNEYNTNGLSPAQYVQLYNAVVPAMQAVDPTIKFTALELADATYLGDTVGGDPRNHLPYFVAPPASGGVNAQVDAVTLHLYSTANRCDTDAKIFSTVPGFANDIRFYQELRSRPDLADVPVWVTESGVNVSFPPSASNLDTRGTNEFLAAWQPYVFSQTGKAGNQGLVQWDYTDDVQRGLVNESNNSPYLSCWVEKALIAKFPWDGVTPGPDILDLNSTETSSVEILSTRNSDGSVVVMMADHAAQNPNDDNGTGALRTVVVDTTSLGTFSTATQLTIDATTEIRALLVDDEDIARERLRQMLASIADVGVVGEAADGEEAIQKTLELQPDLMLLDIQMPGVSGLEVAACLPQPRPKIVFCTAFDTYAVKAFELHAIDYLLKPVSLHRLAEAIERIRQKAAADSDGDVDRLTRAVPGAGARLLARCGGHYKVVPRRDVLHFSSEGGLTKLHTRDRAYLLDPTLSDLEERLDAALFFRLSRASIVSPESIAEVRPLMGGTADVMLTNGATLEVSRRRVRELLDRLGGGLNPSPPQPG